MTALSIRLLRVRAAAALLGPDALVALLEMTHRAITEAAESQGGRVQCDEGHDPVICWPGRPKGESPSVRACRAAWDLLRRFERLRGPVARTRGVAVRVAIGIAGDGKEDPRHDMDPRTLARARLLQRSNAYFGTTILLDAVTRALAARRMVCRRIDGLDQGGHSLIRSPEAVAATGITVEALLAFHPTTGGIYELLGPSGAISSARKSAAVAFEGALDLYGRGEWSKAATVFELLNEGAHPDPVARLYLHTCRRRERDDQWLFQALASTPPRIKTRTPARHNPSQPQPPSRPVKRER